MSVNRADDLNISFMQEAEADYHDLDKKQIEEKFNPSPKYKKQLVEVRGYFGQETTLFNALLDTMKELGGKQQRYLENKKKTKDQEVYKYPISKEQLYVLHKKNKRNSYIMIFVYIIMSPLIIVFSLIFFVVAFITTPFTIFKNRDLIKEIKQKFPHK